MKIRKNLCAVTASPHLHSTITNYICLYLVSQKKGPVNRPKLTCSVFLVEIGVVERVDLTPERYRYPWIPLWPQCNLIMKRVHGNYHLCAWFTVKSHFPNKRQVPLIWVSMWHRENQIFRIRGSCLFYGKTRYVQASIIALSCDLPKFTVL